MNKQDFSVENYLKRRFNADVEMTGEKRYLKDDLYYNMSLNYNQPMPYHQTVRIEHEIAIKMGQSEYTRFVDDYRNYLVLAEQIKHDPVAGEMFNKLRMYLALKY